MDSLFGLILVCFVFLGRAEGESDPFDTEPFPVTPKQGEPLTPQEFINAEKIDLGSSSPASVSNGTVVDPIHIADLFEGDIVLRGGHNYQTNEEKNAVKEDGQKWPNGIVPYSLSDQFDEAERTVIARAILEFNKLTCIRFKPKTSWDKDHVAIVRGQGCSSPVGRVGGRQEISLGPGCLNGSGIAMHEMMHSIGFWHEQSRWDRDDYVTVIYDNIKEGMAYNFHKHDWNVIQNLSQRYDTDSIMHYGPYAFSKKYGLPTILARNPNDIIGQRREFSKLDVVKINALYKCHPLPDELNELQTSPAPLPPDTLSTTTSFPVLSGGGSVPPNCKDSHENCSYWAQVGECEKNPTYMKKQCKQSCKTCQDKNDCRDLNKNCPFWAESKECERNPSYMHKNCRKSCKQC